MTMKVFGREPAAGRPFAAKATMKVVPWTPVEGCDVIPRIDR